jgi:hypothetical protein
MGAPIQQVMPKRYTTGSGALGRRAQTAAWRAAMSMRVIVFSDYV